MAISNTRARITAIAAGLLARSGVHTAPDAQTPLRAAGLDIAALMAVIEAEFGVQVPHHEVMRGSLETVAAIETLIAKKAA